MSDLQNTRGDHYKPLNPEPDAEDLALHAKNCSPQLVTERLRQLVPLAEFARLRFESIGAEETVLTALRPSAVNQNGTQQAAIFYLLADYALGAAMFGVLPGINIIGIHDRGKALPVQCWLKRGTVKHLAPGTLRAVVRMSAESARALRKDLIEKGRGEMRHDVRIYQGDQLVALADHTVGMYPEVPHLPGTELNPFQTQNLKLSALMIAGLREDRLSRSFAGEQGAAIAQRMAAVTLSLPRTPSAPISRT